VKITIGGKSLELRFTLKTLRLLQSERGISVLKGMGDAMRDPEQLAVILFYGLRQADQEITLEWVEDNVDASMLIDLAPVLAYCVTGRWPDMEKLLAALPNAERPAQAGSTSGPLAGTISGSVN